MAKRSISDDLRTIRDDREDVAEDIENRGATDLDRDPGSIELADLQDPEADALAAAGDVALDRRDHMLTPDAIAPTGAPVVRDDPAARPAGKRSSARGNPYERDSDHEYAALEADRGDDAKIDQQAIEFASVDANLISSTGDEDAESMAPSRGETRRRLQDLDDALDESIDRDPEVLAEADARRNATRPDEVQPFLDDMMNKTPLTADQLDTEALMD